MKYVLIVENDDTCYLCPLCEVEFGWHGDVHKGICRRTYDDVTVYLDGVSGRPKWCPLRLLPNKIVERGKWISEEYQNGWNAYRKAMEKMQKGGDSNESRMDK